MSGFGDSVGPYRISAIPIDVTEIAVGDNVQGTISAARPYAAYRVDDPDRAYRVSLNPADDGLDGVLRRIGELWTDTVDDASGGGVEVLVVEDVSVEPDSLIVVAAFGRTSGDYELVVQPS